MMRKSSLIGLGAGGLAIAALVAWKRRPIAAAASSAASMATSAITYYTPTVVREMITGIKQEYINRIVKYNLIPLVEKYRGDIPFGVAMAIMEHESKFDPTIYNYTEDGKLKVGYWKGPGTRKGAGANGLYQIMSHLIPASKGYDAPSVDSLFDPETNIRAALKARNADWPRIQALGVPTALMPTMLYFAHAEGRGKVETVVNWAKKNGGLMWDVILKFPKLTGKEWKEAGAKAADKWRIIYNRLSGIAEVGSRSAVWEAAKEPLVRGLQKATA